jgi:TolB-like protein/Tfp pilus assembly protein PilF
MRDTRRSFGPFVFDTRSGTLQRDGEPVALGGRAAAILRTLLDAAGDVVSKTSLAERAWPGAVVEESNLPVQVAALRKALGERPDGRDWIVTMPRVGYRLDGLDATAATASLTPTLLVAPFANIGDDPEQAWFADGVAEELIAALSRFKSFAVISRHFVFERREAVRDIARIAAEFGVRYVLEGSVRRAGTQLRIVARLVDGASLESLWARTFDGSLGEIFEFQERITESVATLVAPRIQSAEIERSRRERPGSVAVYDIYLRALAKISSEKEADNAEAFALLRQGLAAEPDNPLLLSHAAWALEHRHTMGWPPIDKDDRERCIEYARRGLQAATGDAMVMAHCGVALMQTAKEYDWAVAVLLAAAEQNPNNLLVVARAGLACLHCGDLDDALALFNRANRLSPGDHGSHFAYCGIANVHLIRGDYAEAHAAATLALARNQYFDPTLWMLIAANAHLGRIDEARRLLRQLKALSPVASIAGIRAGQPGKYPERLEALLTGLRMAGLPEA